ncbi:MAG: hypothetical protein MUE68_04100 [Bacteroidetes bacterium]|jgi:hypothetical protein|nr:hypothetical protein [Bacteroidota bacterium]
MLTLIRTLGTFQFFVALGALISGLMLFLAPSGDLLQISTDALAGSPFRDFLIPGLILFLVNGVGQAVAAFLTFRRHRCAGLTGAVFGLGLMIWIFVQVSIIGGGHFLQYAYFGIGVAETSLSFLLHGHLAGQDRLRSALTHDTDTHVRRV